MHSLIVGITNSGKSNLCKRFAVTDKPIIIFDPLQSTGWPESAVKFSDPKKFFDYVAQVQSSLIFCDEARKFWEDGFQTQAEIGRASCRERV